MTKLTIAQIRLERKMAKEAAHEADELRKLLAYEDWLLRSLDATERRLQQMGFQWNGKRGQLPGRRPI